MTHAIRLVDVGKRYRKYHDEPTLVGAALRWRHRSSSTAFWAVRHVELSLDPGSSYGVIGRNGSGKSTLLQLLAGVTAPTEGSVAVRGRVAPMLSVGVGFHPELTGRENVYVNGTILGLTRQEIDGALEEIIDFAEIESFIDTPVKFYSSGMLVRLGFSVAVQTTPDVLLLDEVLAVGDIAFQMKCFDRMSSILRSGTTVVLVSHNLNAVRQLCTEALVLHHGEVRYEGATDDALIAYQRVLDESEIAGSLEDRSDLPPIVDVASLLDVDVDCDAGQVVITAVVGVRAAWPSSALVVLVATDAGVPVHYEWSADLGPIDPGTWTYTTAFDTPLPAGGFSAVVGLVSIDPAGRFDLRGPLPFSSDGSSSPSGMVDLRATVVRAAPSGL